MVSTVYLCTCVRTDVFGGGLLYIDSLVPEDTAIVGSFVDITDNNDVTNTWQISQVSNMLVVDVT